MTVDIVKFTNDFVQEWNGKNLNVNGASINFDGRYGTQCMDLWNYWWTELGLSGIPRHVDAAGVWEDFKGAHYNYFDGILPDKPAKTGDVFIYNRQAWGTGFGHIGIVLADLGASIRVLETNGLGDGHEDEYMNQYGSPARIHEWPKTNLYGYLRYINTAQKEEDMPLTAKDITAVADEILFRKIPRAGGEKGTTNLFSILAWSDANNSKVIKATVAGVMAGNPKATAADISKAVQEAIKGSAITFTAE